VLLLLLCVVVAVRGEFVEVGLDSGIHDQLLVKISHREQNSVGSGLNPMLKFRFFFCDLSVAMWSAELVQFEFGL
jgi:hypothetical protein